MCWIRRINILLMYTRLYWYGMCTSRKKKKEVTWPVNDLIRLSTAPRRTIMRYNTTQTIRLYGRWSYTEITIVPPLTNRYGKISTVVVFNVSIIFWGEEHRSKSGIVGPCKFFAMSFGSVPAPIGGFRWLRHSDIGSSLSTETYVLPIYTHRKLGLQDSLQPTRSPRGIYEEPCLMEIITMLFSKRFLSTSEFRHTPFSIWSFAPTQAIKPSVGGT
jgi:hypothetical protein